MQVAIKAKKNLWVEVKNHKFLFLLLLPAAIWYIIFCYVPMYGNIIAFKSYKFKLGILNSPWVGLDNFERLFGDPDFMRVFSNQIVISLMMLAVSFPFSIILSLMLNEVRRSKVKRFFQTVYTFPHFISWVVVASIFFSLLSSDGIVNQFLQMLGQDKQSILTDENVFRPFLYAGNIWKEAGWGTIIYLATLTGIDTEQYEAAAIDGANKWQQMLHITWPGLKSTVAVMLILSAGCIMSTGFDQIFNLYNAVVMDKVDIIDTYVYRIAIQQGQNFGYSAAIGLFKSIINLIILVVANYSVKILGEEGII